MNSKLIASIVVAVVIIASVSVIYAETNKTKAQPSSITVTDDLGRNVTISLPVKRVVSMDPSNTQMMYAIGAGNLLVADTSFDWWPSNSTSLPHVAMDSGVASVEQVVNMTPDLVLATTIQPAQIVDQLENLSIPVLIFEPQNISNIYSDMLTLGNVTGHQSGAKAEVNHMKTVIRGVENKIANYSKESLLYMMWPSPIYTAGPNSWIDSYLEAAGAVNIAQNLSEPWPVIGEEQVVNDNPQTIIVDNNTGVANITYFTSGNNSQMWSNISAVKNYTLQHPTILILNVTESNWMNEPGPLAIYAVQMIAQFLYPQAFE
ncbi:MAG: ABC transporter substrate-binding protein [Candidatus Thermoplasmatota archaeon]|jgi:iron complex transport system substrate-binding protein|nr:ABC transporter substrate-binding protein [Candidatus Thermoplasmatota archaeon]